jgi:hypothetical protein
MCSSRIRAQQHVSGTFLGIDRQFVASKQQVEMRPGAWLITVHVNSVAAAEALVP